MPTPSRDPNEKGKKPSFWEKLSDRHASSDDEGSLVNAIVKQAEKKADGSAKNSAPASEKAEPVELDEKKSANAKLANAKTLFTFVIIAVAGVWIYFSAMLGESNYFHAKFDKENLTTELNRKTELLQQVRTDVRDTKKFNKLLQVEDLASRITALDLENPILNYERPEGEKVIPREGSTNVLIKTVNDSGEVVYLSEAEILNLENAKKARVEATRAALDRAVTQAETFVGTIKADAQIEELLEVLIAEITAVDPMETDFPSAVMKAHFAAAKSAANEILKKVKSANLENLVADIKKQVNLIDTTNLDETTQKIVGEIRASVANLSAQRPSSFETAFNKISTIDVSKISDNDVYQKVVQVVGDPRQEENDSDLMTASIITRNLGRINTINELRADRIAWSTVIERAEKIVRLGADLARDTEGTPTDATRDIDPNNTLVSLISYAGKSQKGDVEIRGDAYGKDSYTARTFSLLADLIDAFEGSKYFKDVTGFAFSREEDRQGNLSSPINFRLTLQDPAATDVRDVTVGKTQAEATVTGEYEEIDTADLENLDFSLDEAEDTTVLDPEDTAAKQSDTEAEMVGVFDALGATLNNSNF
ncbi:MAG: hypothetical protein K9L85_02485 [Candidatus Peribacteraceae bacterium]|nr:hypothetical protein [Candidatus Peribacteraceae bacterium]